MFESILGVFRQTATPELLTLNGGALPVAWVRNPRARRYALRLRADGTARVTIPRGGSASDARRFVARHADWLERQLQRHAALPRRPTAWQFGTRLLLRGELVPVEQVEAQGQVAIRLGEETFSEPVPAADLRPTIESHLWRLAARELPPQVMELAQRDEFPVRRVTVRNQRSRWGSCSRHGTISLNWRLIQTPPFVSDYIMLHELCHLREMNHSSRFWKEVEGVCPGFKTAKLWLKNHAWLLR